MPFNRVVAFVKPYLNLLAGALAAWLVAKVNVLGLPGIDQAGLANWIAAALSWGLTQGALQLADLKWLKGHQIAMQGDALVQAAALTPAPSPAQVVVEADTHLEPPLLDDESADQIGADAGSPPLTGA